jgi:hypothetical protein
MPVLELGSGAVVCLCVQGYAKLAYAPPKALQALLRQQLMPQLNEVQPPQVAGKRAKDTYSRFISGFRLCVYVASIMTLCMRDCEG